MKFAFKNIFFFAFTSIIVTTTGGNCERMLDHEIPMNNSETKEWLEYNGQDGTETQVDQSERLNICNINSVITESGTIIHSPGFPNYPYQPNADPNHCKATITFAPGKIVVAHIRFFELENKRMTDWLEIRDGNSDNSKIIKKRLYGKQLATYRYSKGNSMTIRFSTNRQNEFRGFELIVFESEDSNFFAERCDDPNYPIGINHDWIYKKPSWTTEVERAFQMAHFGEANGAKGMSINHVMPWIELYWQLEVQFRQAFDCEEKISTWDSRNFQCYVLLFDYIQRYGNVFMLDNEASVHVVIRAPSDRPVNTEIIPDPMRHNSYLNRNNANLMDINNRYLEEAKTLINGIDFKAEQNEEQTNPGTNPIRQQNCERLKRFLLIINSAPANLRYGDSRMNSGIKALDPMGKYVEADGETWNILTQKEQEIFKDVRPKVEHFTTDQPDFPSGYYVKSSSGKYVMTSCKSQSFVRCPLDDKICINI